MNESKTILIIDDDRFMRRATEAALRKHGVAVVSAADGEQGLAYAHDQRPDLILLDVIMPKLNGFEVLRQLKQDSSTAAIPVVLMTALGLENDIALGKDLGAEGYIIKTNTSLRDMVERILQYLYREK